MKVLSSIVGLFSALAITLWIASYSSGDDTAAVGPKPPQKANAQQPSSEKETTSPARGRLPKPRAIAPFVDRGVDWLVKAQAKDGGWSGGSHSQQQIRDPSKFPSDPATTSFVGLALLRSGHSPTSGSHQESVRKALDFLVTIVEKAANDGPLITDIQGTQPQTKLGRHVDTSLTAQFLARVLQNLPKNDKLYARADAALGKCLKKLQVAQAKDGSWNSAGGWAPVLQSSLSCSAFELAKATGRKIDESVLEKARKYQKGNVDGKTGKASAGAAAGVELYAFSASQRANAADTRAARDVIKKAKQEGKLADDADVSVDNLQVAGVTKESAARLGAAVQQNKAQAMRLSDGKLLKGFGNNGGEEFLSFCLTSESLLIAGGDEFLKWQDKMHGTLKKIQNADGSWSGHHCITSPVFCTAAVVQCLTADRDAQILLAIADQATKMAEAEKRD